MKPTARILILAVVTATPILAAATASGDPGKDCTDPKWADHPTCPTTTTTTQPPGVESCPIPESPGGPSVISIGGSGSLTFECDWAPGYDKSIQSATVNVTTVSGEVSRLVIYVRDSNPGDICVLEEWDRPSSDRFEASFPLVLGEETYWEYATNWCSRFDPVAGTRDDLNGEPLHLSVNLRGKKNTLVEISLTPGQTP